MKSGMGLVGISRRDADPSAQVPAAEGKVSMCRGRMFSPHERKARCLDEDGD